MQNLTATKVKDALNGAIEKISASLAKYVCKLGNDFTRKRELPFASMLKTLVGMVDNTICKGLHDWLGYSPDIASKAAFVQQRGKILPEATEDLSHLFTKKSRAVWPTTPGGGYGVFAVHGDFVYTARSHSG